MEEKEYRELVKKAFDQIGNAFDDVDPDLAEYTFSQGAITVQFADQSKLILSQQPSVRQIWLAAASKGVAHHFNFVQEKWMDDKAQGIELFGYIKSLVHEIAAVTLSI